MKILPDDYYILKERMRKNANCKLNVTQLGILGPVTSEPITFRIPNNFCQSAYATNFSTHFLLFFLKSTAGVMKNDVYSFAISHLILKLSHFLYFEL